MTVLSKYEMTGYPLTAPSITPDTKYRWTKG
jgi:hypothetical protein